MIKSSWILLSIIVRLPIGAQKTSNQMGMPMHMFDMWTWLIVLAVIVALAVALPMIFLTSRNRRTPSATSASAQPAPPMARENFHAETSLHAAERPVTKTNRLKKAMEMVRPALTVDERRILNEVVKAGGEVLQSDLPGRSDFSKATVSKLLKSLETMGVVVREKHKWTYWVRLSDKLVSQSKDA